MQAYEIAHVAHRTPRRIRLRIPARRNDAAFFARLEQDIRGRPGIVHVEASPLAASVAITGQHGFDWSGLRLPELGLALAESQPPVVLALPREGFVRPPAGAEHDLRAAPGRELDLPAAIVQVAAIVLARQPIMALVHWLAEALLRAILRELFATEMENRQLALPVR